jgi:hypothetical protein
MIILLLICLVVEVIIIILLDLLLGDLESVSLGWKDGSIQFYLHNHLFDCLVFYL